MKPFLVFFIALVQCLVVSASGSREILVRGNQAYNAGKYDEARADYDKFEAANPESPYSAFNRGMVFFRAEDYEAARKEFQAAGIKTKDLNLEAKANYNLGNCAFMQAGRQTDTDLKKAIQFYYEAIDFYNRTLELDPRMQEAAYNLEITRLILKDMRDKQKAQEKENQEQQEKIKKIVEKLVELVKNEEGLLARSTTLNTEKQKSGISAGMRNAAAKIKREQQATRKQTSGVSGEIANLINESIQAANPQAQPPQAGSSQVQPQALDPENPLVKAKTHTDRAYNFQEVAEKQLDTINLDETITGQENAKEELVKAIEALVNPEQQDQQQPQQQEEEKKEEQKQQQQQATAEDVINQEKENKEKREQQAQGSYYAPLKDW